MSLFDGISCARVALERAGIPVEAYYASEIDKYAVQVSVKNYPDITHIGNVTDFDVHEYDYNDIDLLVGGSPCQDLSIAKKDRKGLEGERSGLFWEYVRILKEVKPKYFILENVNSMPKEAKDIITRELGVEPIMINAALVSAQNRKRLFWTNIPNVTLPEDRGILLKDILEEKVDEKYEVKGCASRTHPRYPNGEKRQKRIEIRNDGKANSMTSVSGDSMIRIGQIGKGGQGDRIYSVEGKSVGLSALGGGRGAKTGLYCVGIVPESFKPKGNYLPRERIFSNEGKFRAISTVSNQQPWVEQGSVIRKLTPVECERLQGLEDGYTEGISNSQRYKCLGNAFNVDVVAHILSFLK